MNFKLKFCSTKQRVIIMAMSASSLVIVTLALWIGLSQGYVLEEKRLEMLHVIMRHGIRTPADTYPLDPHINETLYPIGWGQLTNEGKLQLYNVGKFLRSRYNTFLTSHYSPDEYYTQSTDVDRTKASMQLVNAGIWPPEENQKWGPIDWQPIPVHAEPLDQDMLLLVRKPCANYHKERDQIMASEEIQNKLNETKELLEYLTLNAGREYKDFDDIMDIFSTLKAEEGINLTLPDWTKGYYPDKMLEPTIFSFVLNAYNDKMNRLKGGVLLKKIISDWKAKQENGSLIKTFLYGGHDSTIVNFMRTLKVWDTQFPDYAITILLELKSDINGNFGIEVYLRNSTEVAPFLLTIPGCDSFCTLDKLVELTKDVIAENWDEECKTDDENYTVPPASGP